MNELVSVVIPTYCASLYLQETLDSVRNQTYKHWEMILVDDCSTDATLEIARAYENAHPECAIQIIEQEWNQGAAAARNHGVQKASGGYIAFLDADDLWEPNKIEKELAFAKEHNAAFVCTSYEFADETGKGLGKIARVPKRITYDHAIKNTIIFTSTVVFDMNQLSKEEITMPCIPSEDTATWWNILRSGIVAYGLDEVLVRYRRPAKSLSSNKLKAIMRIWNLYRKQEHFSVIRSSYCFAHYAVRTTLRRL